MGCFLKKAVAYNHYKLLPDIVYASGFIYVKELNNNSKNSFTETF